VVTLTTPPLLPLAAALMKQLKGKCYGIWSMDLHPDAEVASGMNLIFSVELFQERWHSSISNYADQGL
jgi:hypothetical protein